MSFDTRFLAGIKIQPFDLPAVSPETRVREGEAFEDYTIDGEPAVVMTVATYQALIKANHGLYDDLTRSRAANKALQEDRRRLTLERGTFPRWMWAVPVAAFVCGILAARLGQ